MFAEGVLAGIFVAGIEGLFVNMVPITYMDGSKLLRWNPVIWFLLAGLVTFFFWLILLNDQHSYFDAVKETAPAVALIAGGLCLALSAGTWAFFRFRPQ